MKIGGLFAAAVLLTTATLSYSAESGRSSAGGERTASQPNAAFEKFTQPLDSKTQRTVRALTLVNMLAGHCQGATLNRAALQHYVAESGILTIPNDEVDLALAVVKPDFSYFDHNTLVQLCQKTDDLFGARGVLAPGLLSKGSGRPTQSLDARNPYYPVPMLPRRNGS